MGDPVHDQLGDQAGAETTQRREAAEAFWATVVSVAIAAGGYWFLLLRGCRASCGWLGSCGCFR